MPERDYTMEDVWDYLEHRVWRPQFWYKYLTVKPDDLAAIVVDWSHLPLREGKRGQFSLYGYWFAKEQQRYDAVWYDSFASKVEAYSAAFESTGADDLGLLISRDADGEFVEVVSVNGSERISISAPKVPVDWSLGA